MTTPKQTKAAESFTRLCTILNLLRAHPDGLGIDYLAEAVGIPESRLRDEIRDFYCADTLVPRPDTVMFESASGEQALAYEADRVRVETEKPASELGVEFLPAHEWLRIYQTASLLASQYTEDVDLRGALSIIAERILAGVPRPAHSATGNRLAEAIEERRTVRLKYSRAWEPGVNEYLAEPLGLVQTRRGWELDALVDGRLRTFIIDRVREVEITAQTFEPPAGIDAERDRQRRTTTVTFLVPEGYRWAVLRYAESATVRPKKDRLDDLIIDAEFLPPVAERVGLVLITARDSMVIDNDDLQEAGSTTAQRLLEHHGLQDRG